MKLGLVCLLLSFVALSLGSARAESLTYDERFYMEEGRRIWNERVFTDPYNPPLLPAVAAIGGAGRLAAIALGAALLLAVSRVGGLAAAAVLSFEPTFLAYSHYVTSDVAVTLFVFLAAVATNPWFLGVSVGLALASKMSSLLFLPIVLFGRKSVHWRVVAPVACMVLWASYFFTWDVVIRQRQDPSRLSYRLTERNNPFLRRAIVFLQTRPLPLGTYVATVKNTLLRVGRPTMVVFDGRIYDRPRWYFLIVNVVRKLPIPFLVLVALGARHRPRFALAALGMIGGASLAGMAPLVRFVLPAVPLLAVVGAAGMRRPMFVLLLLWQIVSTLSQYPHFISYANALAGPRRDRFTVFADSNLDWGQALPDLLRYGKSRNAARVSVSYFGRMNAQVWRFEDICAFTPIDLDPRARGTVTAISVSNWYYCGYYRQEPYRRDRIWDVVADSVLVF